MTGFVQRNASAAAIRHGQQPDALNEVDAAVDPGVLDLQHLARYTNGDKGLEAELLGLFKLQAVQQIEAIANCRDAKDWQMSVHTLKGSARGVGAVHVAKICAELENTGFDGCSIARRGKIEQLKLAVTTCVVAIEKLAGIA